MTAASGWSLRGNDLVLHIRVQPRAAHEGFAGEHGGRLKVRVSAPPIEGAANARLVEILSRTLGVPRSAVAIARGAQARDKDIVIRGAAARAAQLVACLRQG